MRIHYVKQFPTYETQNSTVGERINEALQTPGNPRIVAIYPIQVEDSSNPPVSHVLVVIERDDRRSERRGPSKVSPRIKRTLERRRQGNGNGHPAEPTTK